MGISSALAPFAATSALSDAAPPELVARAAEQLDAFFARASGFQARREPLAAVDDSFRVDTRAVFQLYTRLGAALQQTGGWAMADESLAKQALHVTRIAPFCQVFALRNADAIHELLRGLVEAGDDFTKSLRVLRAVYCQRFEQLHSSVARGKRADVIELTHSLYEMALSLRGFLSPSTVELLFLGGSNAEVDLSAPDSSLVVALARCYELDLPTLQRQLSTFDETHAIDKLAIIADTRRIVLQSVEAYLNALMETSDDDQADPRETFLAVLHQLTHCSGCTEHDTGSLVSDLWLLYGLKDKVVEYFTRHEMDREQLEYLEMVIDGLPKRRIVAKEVDSAASQPNSISKSAAKASFEEEKQQASSADPTEEAALASLVDQVKDFFPDLGEGYIELCLLSSKKQVEVVINFLLEANPPPELSDLPQSLSQSDPKFASAKARLTGKSSSSTKKLDPSQVWVGKKPQEKAYDPQIAKKDQELVDKMKQIVAKYEEEDEIMASVSLPGEVKIDEYDDDYNDEFEDYEPFSVHDGGQLDDQEAVREMNRRIRAKEEEDAFWESMKNPNHRAIVEDDDDDEGKEDLKASPDGKQGRRNDQKPQASRASGGPFKKAGDKRKGGKPAFSEVQQQQQQQQQQKEPETPQQQQRARARKDKNKAKVANHNRKDRALKKMG